MNKQLVRGGIGVIVSSVALYAENAGLYIGRAINTVIPCVQDPSNSAPCFVVYDAVAMFALFLIGLLSTFAAFYGIWTAIRRMPFRFRKADPREHAPHFVALEVLVLFLCPIASLFFGIIPMEYRLTVIGAAGVATVVIALYRGWSPHQLGMRLDNFRKGFASYAIFTFASGAVLYASASALHMETMPWPEIPWVLLLFIPISFAQEFMYRSFLMRELARVFASPAIVILANAALFALLHVIYGDPLVVLPITFIGGMGLALLYREYPNLWLASGSHAVLNFIGVFCNYFLIR